MMLTALHRRLVDVARRKDGVTAIEFAIVAPLLILLLFSILQALLYIFKILAAVGFLIQLL